MSYMTFPDPDTDGPQRDTAAPSLVDLYTAQFALCLTPWTWMNVWWQPWAVQEVRLGALEEVPPVAADVSDPVADDLTRIEGIGPKLAAKLSEVGVTTFATLAATPVERLEAVIAAAGARFRLARPESWPQQAALLAAGDEKGFAALTAELRGGVRR